MTEPKQAPAPVKKQQTPAELKTAAIQSDMDAITAALKPIDFTLIAINVVETASGVAYNLTLKR